MLRGAFNQRNSHVAPLAGCRYNAILAVPYQLERFLWFGMLVCLDSFLVSAARLGMRAVVAY